MLTGRCVWERLADERAFADDDEEDEELVEAAQAALAKPDDEFVSTA